MKFSVLLSIYHKEKPVFFDRAMQSIWDEQTLKPNEIVLVKDGTLTPELDEVIQSWEDKCNILKVVTLQINQGLGKALNIGLEKCSYEWVARMDTDDISLPHRFEKQINFIKTNPELVLLGSYIGEFIEDENKISKLRKVPTSYNKIKKISKYRNPFNHPSVFFKKEIIINVGGYQNMLFFEDWFLWIRIILSEQKVMNMEEMLINMRTQHQLGRRRGFKYFKYEFNYFLSVYKLGHLSFFEFLLNLTLRAPLRFLPNFILRMIYKKLRQKNEK